MNWFDFTDLIFLSFFIIVCICIVLLIIFFVSIGTFAHSETKFNNSISEEGKATRIFILNPKEDKVVCFYKTDIKNKQTLCLMDFYNLFHQNDVERIKQWIVHIQTSNDPEEFLEADSLKEHSKSSFFCLLRLVAYNAEKGLIHIESNMLKHITPINKLHKRHGAPFGAMSQTDLENYMKKTKSAKGYVFSIQFFSLKQQVLANEKIEKHIIKTLKNVIYPYATNKTQRQILDCSDHELFLFDLRLSKDSDAITLANSIAHALKKRSGVNGYDTEIKFSIGVVPILNFYGEPFSKLKKAAIDVGASAQSTGELVKLYKSNSGEYGINNYESAVNNVINNMNLLRIQYRPIVDVEKGALLGYCSKIKITNTPFSSYFELMRYASKMNKNDEIFASSMNKVIETFFNERPDVPEREKLRIFITLSLVDCENILAVLPQIPHIQNVKVVLVFDEMEINDNSASSNELSAFFKMYHNWGFELALIFKDKYFHLDSNFYSCFDFFIIDARIAEGIKKNQRTRLNIHGLVEQILHYKKPIIATDIKDKQSIELIIRSGITYVSADDICGANDNLLPVDKKKMDKLSEMHKN